MRLPFDDDTLIEASIAGPGDGSWFLAVPLDGSAPLDVHGVVPGDRVLLRADRSVPGRAELVALLEPGFGRRTPPCRLANVCGGCHWLQIEEVHQQGLRRRRVLRELGALGLDIAHVALRTVAAPAALAGRARARFQTAFSGKRPKIGLHRLGRPQTLDVPECPVLAPEVAAVYARLREVLLALAPADLTGFEIVALPAAPGALVALNPRDRAPATWPQLGDEIMAACDGLVAGVAVRSGRAVGVRGARAVLGRVPGGGPVAVGACGFVQSHLVAAERLADEVVRLAGARPGAAVLELYAGSGFLGWRLAAAGAQVTAAEVDPLAVGAAALLPPPGRGALALHEGDAATFYAAHATARAWDAVVADPPRGGLGPLAARLAESGPRRLVLVSCSVRGLARDLPALLAGGYRLVDMVQVDMFPQTRHAETVVALER